MFSVHLCLSVFNDLTFENPDLETSFLLHRYIFKTSVPSLYTGVISGQEQAHCKKRKRRVSVSCSFLGIYISNALTWNVHFFFLLKCDKRTAAGQATFTLGMQIYLWNILVAFVCQVRGWCCLRLRGDLDLPLAAKV